jgi:hypothetical protein
MERYGNLSGNSGVTGYEIGPDFIEVRFAGGTTYVYTYRSAGQANVEHMKLLAARGKGLATFISTTARRLYASKR